MKITRTLLLTALLLLVPVVGAQQGDTCGSQYVVQRGDTLTTIATTCDTTVEALREANPNVFSLIRPGDVLLIPDPEAEPGLAVSLSAANGPTLAALSVTGFPANTGIRVGVGRAGEVALDARALTTDAEGRAAATLTIPADVPANAQLFATAVTDDNTVQVTSDLFTPGDAVTPTPTTPNPGAGGGDANNPNEAEAAALVPVDFGRLAPVPAPFGVNANGALFDRVIIYLVREGDNGTNGIAAACNDSIVPVLLNVDTTVAPLTASLDALLRRAPADLDLPQLSNPSAGGTLVIDQVDIINGQARVELTGNLPAGLSFCDGARIVAQMEATALQYNTVTSVTVTVNGLPLANVLP